MKKNLIVIIFLVISLYSQDSIYEDSLKTKIEKSVEKNKLDNIINLVKYYTKYSPQKAIETSRTGIKIAQKYNFEKIGQLYLLIIQNFSAQTKHDSVEFYSDLALDFYTAQNDTNGLCNTLLNIGINYDILGEQEKALGVFKKVEDLATKQKLDETLAAVYINSGVIFMSQGKYKEALEDLGYSIDDIIYKPIDLNELLVKVEGKLNL